MKFNPQVAGTIAKIIVAAFLMISGDSGYAKSVDTETEAMARATAANEAGDYATSIAIYRKLADQGSAAAPAMIGVMYFSGAGVPLNHTLACDFFATSEQRRDPTGTELLADCFFKGDGRARDYSLSADLYRKASARGFPMADCALGNQYLGGLGVEKNATKAAALCRKSADRGVPDAEADLGQMYFAGEGVERNLSEAAVWFQKAVDQGNANAAFILGTMYWNGDGVQRDHERAAKMWHQSAERGNTSAPARLALYYFTGSLNEDKRIVIDPALKAAYWAIVATRVDPDPSGRIASQKLVDMLFGAAPSLRPKVETMLTTTTRPTF
jgi:TPR repeat protein